MTSKTNLPSQAPAGSSAFDVAAAYRICPLVAKVAGPLPFSNDKLLLSEICLRSFRESLGKLRAKVWAVLDGCPPEYIDLFRRYFAPEDLGVVELDRVGNHATFGKQIDILLEQSDADLLYFAEDDYVYLADQFARMVQFLQAHDDADFVSPYDHPDCYNLEIHQYPKWVRAYAGHHWRTAGSTCLTFLTRKETLRRKERIFRTYGRRNHDCSLWLTLTKHSLFDPFRFLGYAHRQPLFAKIMAKAWLYGWPQILFGERMKLWVPVPGIATHLNTYGLSPTIDWIALMKKEAEAIALEGARRTARAGAGFSSRLTR